MDGNRQDGGIKNAFGAKLLNEQKIWHFEAWRQLFDFKFFLACHEIEKRKVTKVGFFGFAFFHFSSFDFQRNVP